jgi:hypothetical protein
MQIALSCTKPSINYLLLLLKALFYLTEIACIFETDFQNFLFFTFHRAHPRTRVFIEQVNGQLKMKFPCLSAGLRLPPKQACRTIVACTVLFNLAKEMLEPDIEDNVPPPDPPVDDFQGDLRVGGLAVRSQIVQDFF